MKTKNIQSTGFTSSRAAAKPEDRCRPTLFSISSLTEKYSHHSGKVCLVWVAFILLDGAAPVHHCRHHFLGAGRARSHDQLLLLLAAAVAVVVVLHLDHRLVQDIGLLVPRLRGQAVGAGRVRGGSCVPAAVPTGRVRFIVDKACDLAGRGGGELPLRIPRAASTATSTSSSSSLTSSASTTATCSSCCSVSCYRGFVELLRARIHVVRPEAVVALEPGRWSGGGVGADRRGPHPGVVARTEAVRRIRRQGGR